MTCPTRTACPYCGVGCGVLATPDGKGGATVAGDPDHPANFGRLCSKGSALGETLALDDRLLFPQIAGRRASWDEAIALTAATFREAIDAHGPDSVAFYVSGQLLTEDYYVANKLMKGFIGSGNIDTNSRLCMASAVAGHRRAFGTDTVPTCYEDLEQADLVVLTGSNLAWCHPVLYQRIAAAKAARPGMKVVTIDPRRTATSDLADLHLGVAPGSDAALFNFLLHRIQSQGAIDAAYVLAHVDGLPAAMAEARRWPVERAAEVTGLAPRDLEAFAALWIRREKGVTLWSQGLNQSSSGADKANAIINCHLATGRIGRPGMGPFSITGQPNAMGGREVGGLANMLAAHLDLENPAHRAAVQGFWGSPAMAERPGLKAVDLFEACAEGRIKALWIMSTNPAVSMPEADRVRDAIRATPFVAVSEVVRGTDTGDLADVLLPAAAWGEKTGTVTNSERRITRQRAFLPAPGEALADWDQLARVGRAMGFEGFDFASPAEVFREHAALSAMAGRMGRDFDLSGLEGISDADYDALAPVQWPVTEAGSRARFFADGKFHTETGRARMLPVAPRAPESRLSAAFPLRLNTGRVRDHWHTMTRTAKTPRLSRHIAEPFAEIHPADADAAGISPADLVHVIAPEGRVTVRALVTDRTPRGAIFVPMHWTSQWASAGRVDAAVRANVDPVSGQPELKGAAARIERADFAWQGFAVSAARPEVVEADYWALARAKDGWRAELAGLAVPADWAGFARRLFGLGAEAGEMAALEDPARGMARIAVIEDGRVLGALFAGPGPGPVEVARAHVAAALGEPAMPDLLAGRPGADRPDPGATVCACYEVGVNAITAAIAAQGLADVAAVGAALGAGTNCGSCRPELQALLDKARADGSMAA
ncbi:assimilatory nitrate reductase (NADH) alpha subunit apoprotein [Albimonas donghaensis]|uniref:Assimilatory nitrate reductase (NADH) alpha subunit apoprotein n=1 Tax=Albimonas donghaensis TaxID=356660 RepID=A0A1H3BT16_9RHOB|nr:nitrate reductase [Albimonas donghaensis]SDX44936.1 assimilatory nitrate reductase (NADH) alpha subunit apoprotein [Albimonas donghaensis]